MIRAARRRPARGPASVRPVRVATWNVNSVKQRVPRLLPWLDERKPDVSACRRPSSATTRFDELLADEFARRGYAFARHGQAQWNGVAILSRVGLDDIVVGVPGRPASRAGGSCRCPRPATAYGCTPCTYRTVACRI